jgi:hypothetical protein
MFSHSGPKALWPVIFFLPWFVLGSVYLGDWALDRGARWIGRSSTGAREGLGFSAARLRLIGLALLLMTAPLALADPLPAAEAPCTVATPGEARTLGDTLFEQGAYQSAGDCYQAAGELALANRAYVKAVEPRSAATARQLSDQRDQAKTMLSKVELAFHPGH